ncbi:MAG: hypothetical protein ACK5LN_11020 [Propioniciclava sp.]
MLAVDIDVGGSGIKAALVDPATGDFHSRRTRVVAPGATRPHAVAEAIAEMLSATTPPLGAPVGIALPAVVTADEIVHTAANIHDSWIGLNARTLLEDRLGWRSLSGRICSCSAAASPVHGSALPPGWPPPRR